MQSLSELLEQAESEILGAADLAALDGVRVRYLGKKGELTARLKGLSSLSPEERPAAGWRIFSEPVSAPLEPFFLFSCCLFFRSCWRRAFPPIS